LLNDHDLIHRLIELIEYKNQYQQQTAQLQPQDMYVLERIWLSKNISARDLTERYHIPASTLTGILDRLEKKELIRRIRSSNDRRSIQLTTTALGNRAVSRHLSEDRQFAQNLFSVLDMDKRDNFRKLLAELIEGVDKDRLFCEDIARTQTDPEES
jgi:DNA-binding MarR family transcriptional regulator